MLIRDYYEQLVTNRDSNIEGLTYLINKKEEPSRVISLSHIRDPLGDQTITDLELVKGLLENTARYQKYDFNSSYPYHRPVPSVRALNTVDISVVICLGDVTMFGRYNAYLNRLERYRELTPEENCKLPDNVRDGNIYFVFSSTFKALASFYGEFAFQISLIDTGHLIGQASVVLQVMERVGTVERFSSNLRQWEESPLFDEKEIVLSLLSVDAQSLVRDEFEGDVHSCSFALPDRKLFSEFTHSVPLRAAPSSAVSSFSLPRLSGRAEFVTTPSAGIADASMGRSSAHNQLGSSSLLVRDAHASLTEIFSSFDLSNLATTIDIFVLENTGSDFSLSSYDVASATLRSLGKTVTYADVGSVSSQRRSLLTLDSFAAIVFLAVKSLTALEEMSGVSGIEEAFVKCGIVGQYVCIQATRQGFFVRPIKGTNESMVNELLGESLFYTLLVGVNNVDAVYTAI